MEKFKEESIFGLVTACDWDKYGNPLKIKICTSSEEDFFVVENELGKSLLSYLRVWVEVRGSIIPSDSSRIIDIKEIKQKIGERI